MSDEELARIHQALSDPAKIEALRLTPKLENQQDIGKEIGKSQRAVNRYISEFEDTGLIETQGPEQEKSYELTERGEKALSNDLLNASTHALITPLDEYWPALAYATCNSPREELGGSINQKDIVEQAEHLQKNYDLSTLLKSAKKEGYVSQKGMGDWEITEEGAELLQEGFDFEDENIGYESTDSEAIIKRLKQRALEKFWPALLYVSSSSLNGYSEEMGSREVSEDLLEEAIENGYIERGRGNNLRITDKGEELTREGFDFKSENISYPENNWEDLVERLEFKAAESSEIVDALTYAFRASSNSSFSKEGFVDDVGRLSSVEELEEKIDVAEDLDMIRENRNAYELTGKSERFLSQGFEFEEANLGPPEMTQEEWRQDLSQENEEGELREVLTVNKDILILEGGTAMKIKRPENGLEEGDQLRVEETGEKIINGEFDEVEAVE
jgi:predicted transcriptional regulator